MQVTKLPGVAVIGAGLAGCLLGVYLRRMNYEVDIFESRTDMRKAALAGGRSINLILTSRGLTALDQVGLMERMLAISTPVHSRGLHLKDGSSTIQQYGPDETYCNYSISRSGLNIELLNACEELGVRIHFDHPLEHIDIPRKQIFCYARENHRRGATFSAKHIFCTDGAGSRGRQALKLLLGNSMLDTSSPLGASYKELLCPSGVDGEYLLDKNSLHIWPRGSHFLMGLPNLDGSCTMTLYLPDSGEISLHSIMQSDDNIRQYFEEYYPDFVNLCPDYIQQVRINPQGFLGTVRSSPWYYKDNIVLLGDAAHAIVPFFGQGCNIAFEGVQILCNLMKSKSSVSKAFSTFFETYKPNADKMADLAIENYYEMMNHSGDEHFQAQKAIEIELSNKYPTLYLSRYAMITHTNIPIFLCAKIGLVQQEILDELCPERSTERNYDHITAEHLVKTKLVSILKKCNVTKHDLRDVTRELVLKANKSMQKQLKTQTNGESLRSNL